VLVPAPVLEIARTNQSSGGAESKLIRLQDDRFRAIDSSVAAVEWRVKGVGFSFLQAPLARETKLALPTLWKTRNRLHRPARAATLFEYALQRTRAIAK
jgi:hypothetical protein